MDKDKAFVRLEGGVYDDATLEELDGLGEVLLVREEAVVVSQPISDVFRDDRIDVDWVTMNLGNGVNVEDIESLKGVRFASYFVNGGDGREALGVTGLFYLKSERTDEKYLHYLEETYGVDVVDLIGYQSRIIKILLDKHCPMNVFELERRLNEESSTIWTQIGYLSQIRPQCTADPFFNQQWGLENTGQNGGTVGADINFCQAHAITPGSPDITVAVVDEGMDMNHLDLTVAEQFVPDANAINLPFGDHGTLCGGIIGSEENGIGGVGVAPNCRMVSCAVEFGNVMQTDEWLAQSIDWAWQNGVDVISNSWGGGPNNNNINDAIDNALTQGRNGLGCVVVFSSGNDDGDVGYPANSNPDILAVGAVDRCGIRSGRADVIDGGCDPWGVGWRPASQFGDELDVVAPGTNVFTTDISGTGNTSDDYDNAFAGTSAATPYVAGLAALILSVNPCLTVQEVNTIIESSCQKSGGYAYQNEAGRPNGTWHQEVGYGLIDAGRALEIAANTLLQNETVTGELLVNTIGTIRAGEDVNPIPGIDIGPYIIEAGADVEFKATETIILEPGFIAEDGSEFLAHIEDFTGDCQTWNEGARIIVDSQPVTQALGKPEAVTTSRLDVPEQNFLLFPNPYHDELYIKHLANSGEEVTLQVFDVTGKELASQSYEARGGEEIRRVDLGDGGTGIFFLRCCIGTDCEIRKIMRYAK